MKQSYLLLALSGLIWAGCASDDYVGDHPDGTRQTTNTIAFGAGSDAVTRAEKTGTEAATLLGNAIKVYGTKQNATTTTNYDKVFVDYTVKYDTGKDKQADYNKGWYYVGEGSQTIKYWDYASANYQFVAGSPVANFTYTCNTNGGIASAAVTGLGGRLNHTVTVASNQAAVYVAAPVKVAKTDYNKEVKFSFKRLHSKVRVGIYETIPGYKITNIKFYDNATTEASSQYITLNASTEGYFQGATAGTGTITYDWTTPSYTFSYETTGLTKGKSWEGAQYSNGVKATSSTGTVADLYGTDTNMDTSGYFVVMPTPSATSASALSIKCDYTLTSLDGSGETINVKGATATIPDTYTKWVENTAYTYLFKISDNTNGHTGSTSDPAGLYPIVFDAVVQEVDDANQGTETTVSTPSITCYQANGEDVVTNGITFKAGKDVVVTSSAAANLEIKKLSGTFDYTKTYDKQAYETSFAAVTATNTTTVTLTTPAAATYVVKATASSTTAYFVLVVGSAESGPTNP